MGRKRKAHHAKYKNLARARQGLDNSSKRRKLDHGSDSDKENVPDHDRVDIDASDRKSVAQAEAFMYSGYSMSSGMKPRVGGFQCVIPEPEVPVHAPELHVYEFSLGNGGAPHDASCLYATNSRPCANEPTGPSDRDSAVTSSPITNDAMPNLDIDDQLAGDTLMHPNVSQEELRAGKLREAPTENQAWEALVSLREILRPCRKTGKGHKDPHFDPFSRIRMEGMEGMLNLYVNQKSKTYQQWRASAHQAAISIGRGNYCARQLARLSRQFIEDRTVLPVNPYGDWNESMLCDEDLSSDLTLYLQEVGKNITARKVVEFLARPDVMEKHGITKKISERTARRYLETLGYRWSAPVKGQYADGHERADVVWYRDRVFLPQWGKIQERMRNWTRENIPECGPLPGKRVVVWFHDESIFYAHDRRRKTWYHKDAPAKPYAKGEGSSLMIADYVSADFGWLQSPDGKQSARRVMRPGKNKDGYFTSDDIDEQANEAMDILTEHYPGMEHVFVYDNASTHLKRPEDSLSARHMPKFTPKEGNNWKIEVTKRTDGKPIYNSDGTYVKEKIKMCNARFADGTPQELYFPEGHPRAGVFKGMAVILQERGLGDMSKVRAECKSFKCEPSVVGCCCRRILYNQPDFLHVNTILEETCAARGFKVIFLPKFHCELNFIEQCWGYAKRLYRLNPESSREDHLERNALAALDAVPLESMRRFANRSRRFMDAYTKGLNGRQAAWAARKYRGHRVLPESLLTDLEKENII